MKNQIQIFSRSPRELWRIRTDSDFNECTIRHALDRYRVLQKETGGEWGDVLCLCSTGREAAHFVKYGFRRIVLTGGRDDTEEILKGAVGDPRVTYEKMNAECLAFKSGSFDLVFCKDGLHHLPRPLLGLYEMLRVAKRGVIVIEPNETPLGNLLKKMGLASRYESERADNLGGRRNYVFRFSRSMLRSILNSYYLDSGYRLEIHLGWLTWKLYVHRSRTVRILNRVASILAGRLPGSRGNLMTAIILPGGSKPPDVQPFGAEG